MKPGDAAGLGKLAEVSELILKNVHEEIREETPAPPGSPAKPAQKGGMDATLRREAREALRDARLKLVRLEPELASHWAALQRLQQDDPPGSAEEGRPLLVEIETLVHGTAGGLGAGDAAAFVGDDLGRLSEFAFKSAAHPSANGEIYGLDVAEKLWHGGKRDAATAWLWKLFKADAGDTYGSPTIRALLIEALANCGDTRGILEVVDAALLKAVKPAPLIDAFPKRDSSGGFFAPPRQIRRMIEQVSAFGLAGEVRAKLEMQGGSPASELVLLLRVQMREAAALPEIVACIGKPMPPLFLEELAGLLDGWNEGRAATRAALLKLEAAHTLQTPRERLEQLALHGWLAARCGMEREATRWLLDAFAQQRLVYCNQTAVLLRITEGLLLCPHSGKAKDAALELAGIINQTDPNGSHFTSDAVVKKLRELGHERNDAAVRLLSSVLKPGDEQKDEVLAAAIRAAEREIDLHSEKAAGFSPVALVRARLDDGTSEIGWTHVSFSPGDREHREMLVEDPRHAAVPWRGRVELFFGDSADRLERFAIIENAEQAGEWRGRLPKSKGWLAISIGTGGTAVLGPPIPVHSEKNLLPTRDEMLRKHLPALIWKKRKDGPGGEAFESVELIAPNTGQRPFGSSAVEIAGALGKDLTFSGWGKHGNASLVPVNEDGQSPDNGPGFSGEMENDWRYFEVMVPAASIAQYQQSPGGKLRGVALKLTLGGSYSGLRVVATEPKPPEKN